LYKYLFKGNKKVTVELQDENFDLDPKDEIKRFIRGRMLCAMDATWRIFGFQNYPASFPSCTIIKVKLPAHLLALEQEQTLCDLSVYFARPQICRFENLKYAEFYKEWDYSYKKPARFNRLGQ
jgi:hypothetical protein